MAVRRRRAKGHMHLHVRGRALVSERPVPAHAHTDPLQICLAPVEFAVGGLATCVVIGGRAVSKACATQLAPSRPPSKSLAKSRISGVRWLIAKSWQARTRPGVSGTQQWRTTMAHHNGAEQIETHLRQLGDLLLGAWGEQCLR